MMTDEAYTVVLGRTGRKIVAAVSSLFSLIIASINSVTVAISSFATNYALPDLIGMSLTLVILIIGFYELSEEIYKRFDRVPHEDPILRTLFTLIAASPVFLFPWASENSFSLIPAPQATGGASAILFAYTPVLSTIPIAIIAIVLYLADVSDDRLFGDGGLLGEIIRDDNFQLVTNQARLEDEIIPRSGKKGWAGLSAKFDLAGGVGVGLVVPAFLAGLTGLLLSPAFPVLELLVLGWAGWGTLNHTLSRFSGQSTKSGSAERRGWRSYNVDLEGKFQKRLYLSVSSTKGLPSIAIILLGMGISAGYIWNGMSVLFELSAGEFDQLISTFQVPASLFIWDILGTFILLFVGGAYGLWAWYREIHRLSSFLNCWDNGRQMQTEHIREGYPRAPGFVLLPAVLGILAFDFARSVTVISSLGTGMRVSIALRQVLTRFALLWPASLLFLIIVTWWLWDRTDDDSQLYQWFQSVRYEDAVMVGGVTIQYASVTESPTFPINSTIITGLFLAAVVLIGSSDIEQYIENNRSGILKRRYYLLVGSVLLVVAVFLSEIAIIQLVIGINALRLLVRGLNSTQ
jgi:hypothetical protein